MKKFITFILLFVAVVLLCSCQKKYSVTFKSDGLANPITIEVPEGTCISEELPGIFTDHLFSGWYNGDVKFDFNNPITSDVELVAKWDLETFKITFKDEDGTVLKEETLDIHSTIVAPAEPTKASDDDFDYAFAGWDIDFNFAVEDLVITAKYNKTIRKYTVTYCSEDGNTVQEAQVEKGQCAVNLNQNKADDTKYSYSFMGWYTEDGNKYAFTTPITGDVKLYSKFNAVPLYFNFENKKISFVGASISTFYAANSSVNSYYSGKDEFYYPTYSADVKSVDKTWWKILVDRLGCGIGINNSLSGSCLTGSGDTAAMSDYRINTLGENGTPDVIITFIGVNDNVSGVSNEVFEAGYNTMLDKIEAKYPNAYVFVCTFTYSNYHLNQPTNHGKYSEETRIAYNEIIRKIASERNVALIDFAEVGTADNYRDMLGDNLHYNANGMRVLATKAYLDINAYFNQGKQLNSILYSIDADTTLSDEDKIVYYQDEVIELPEATKEGYDFLGWYLNEDLSGNPITTTEGLNEDLILYPYFEKTLKEGEFRVYFEVNGGILGMVDREEIRTEFLKDFGAFCSTETDTVVFSDLSKAGPTGFGFNVTVKEDGSHKIAWASPQNCWRQVQIVNFFNSEEYGEKWTWLNEYIYAQAINDKAYVLAATTKWHEPCLLDTYAFLMGVKAAFDGHESPDYSDMAALEEVAHFLDYATYSKKIYTGTATLPTPTKEGAVFAGWYLNADFSGDPVTEVTEGCRVYAKWN